MKNAIALSLVTLCPLLLNAQEAKPPTLDGTYVFGDAAGPSAVRVLRLRGKTFTCLIHTYGWDCGMGHMDVPGYVLWFPTGPGRLAWFHRAPGCNVGGPLEHAILTPAGR